MCSHLVKLKNGACPLIKSDKNEFPYQLTNNEIIKTILQLANEFPEIIKPWQKNTVSSFGIVLEIFTIFYDSYQYGCLINLFANILQSQCSEEDKINQIQHHVVSIYASQRSINNTMIGKRKLINKLGEYIKDKRLVVPQSNEIVIVFKGQYDNKK